MGWPVKSLTHDEFCKLDNCDVKTVLELRERGHLFGNFPVNFQTMTKCEIPLVPDILKKGD